MGKYAATYRVRVSDVDALARIKLSALLSLMQEAATEHAQALGVGRRHLLGRGLGWALSKLTLTLARLPRWGERITIETWPSARTRISTDREFVLRAEDGAVLGTARTLWVLFNLRERRIERLAVLGDWPAIEEFADDTRFERPVFPQTDGALASEFGVRKDDIDLNGHVNNAVYITWALEPLSREFWETHEPARIAMWFVSEVSPGERVRSECAVAGEETFHRLMAGGTERARIAVAWRACAEKPIL